MRGKLTGLLLLIAVSFLAFLIFNTAEVQAYCVGATYSFSCGDTVNESCVMDKNETTTGSCFTVDRDDITIDCNGHRITGDGTGSDVGIDVKDGSTNTTIKNCQIDGFSEGLYLRKNINTTVFNNLINRNTQYGINAPGANYTNITNNTINDNGAEGIYLHTDSRFATISNNRIYNNGEPGIRLTDSKNHTVRNNIIYRNAVAGLFASNVTYPVIFNNTVYENTRYGINLSQSPNANLTKNTVYGNEYNIIVETDSDNSLLQDNIAFGATRYYGIYLFSNRNAVLINNSAYTNALDGFYSNNGRGANYVNNTAYRNSGNGFKAVGGDNSNYTDNIAYENADADFLLAATSSCILVNNTAHDSRWGFRLGQSGLSSSNVLENNTAYNESTNAFSIDSGSNNNLTNNIAYDSNVGFGLYNGPTTNNTLRNNIAHDNYNDGFTLSSAGSGSVDNNLLFNNTAYNNNNGFNLGSWGGSVRNNNLTNNIAHHNQYNGFFISMWSNAQGTYLENNYAYSNSVSNEASAGFVISGCSGAVLINNTAQGNLGGIALTFAENATLINNTMNDNNFYNFALWGDTDAQHNHTIGTTNLADDKPIYYIKNANNAMYDSTNATTFYCIWCNNVTIKNLELSRQAFGVYLWTSNNSLVESIDGTYTYNLIRLANSSNNTFNNINMGVNYDYDFESSIGFSNWTLYAERDSLNNTFNDFNFNGVTVDFVASDVVMRKTSNLAAPSGYESINKNIEAEDNSGSGSGTPYLFMNISYEDSDIAGMSESSLFIARNNGTWELSPSAFSNPYGVNSAENYVYANITDFGSDFVILGEATEQQGGGGGGGGSYIPPVCGDSICDSRRESYLTCPSDCDAPENPPENISYDCGDLNKRGCQTDASAQDTIQFIVKNTTHILQIDGLTDNSIDVWIWSDPIKATINLGETKQFDLDKNNYNDFSITLNSITNGKANLILKSLSEAVPSGERTAPQQQKPCCQNLLPWIIVVGIAILIVVAVIIVVTKREKKLRYLGYK